MKQVGLVEVRRLDNDSTKPWIVNILDDASTRTRYVQPDGSRGRSFCYIDKLAALSAASLYYKKQEEKTVEITTSAGKYPEVKTCGACVNYDPQAVGKCCIDGRMTKEPTSPVNACDRFKPLILTGETKETNPKDIIGMKKAPISTLSCAVLFEMGLGMLEGARKYGRHNYRALGVSATVYYDAAVGHLMDWFEGEDIDLDSGLSHVTKALTTLLVLRDSMLMGNWVDDRPLRNPNKLYKKHFNPKAKEIIEKYPDCVEPYLEANKELDRTKPISGGY